MSFLAVTQKKVIDVEFQAEIVEDLDANPPIAGAPEVAEVSHQEVDQTYVEDSAAQIAKNLNDDRGIEYYGIRFNPQLKPQLHEVKLKGGARASGPSTEIVEIEADGVDVGSAVVDA